MFQTVFQFPCQNQQQLKKVEFWREFQLNFQGQSTKKSLMTATLWDFETMQPNGWWMTEKYDGMRLFWDQSNFYTRQGTKVKVPQFISSQLPPISLDGELWFVNKR